MGRIFETRKHVMFARWNRMAKQFTLIGKDISIAVRSGGPDPDNNPALRRVIQNARAVNMPKDKVESAIKRASGKDVTNYEEVIYEGYAPHGVAVLVQTATDNPTRTVGNIRNVFNKNGGNLGTSGSVEARCALVTATTRNRPPLTCGSDTGMLENINITCPPMTSTIAGPSPLYGTSIMSTFAISLNSSAAM